MVKDMKEMKEEQSKMAPGPLALIQALVNTQYGQGRRQYIEITSPEQLCNWLVEHKLLTEGTLVTEGDFRRVLALREALRSLLLANNEIDMLAFQVEVFNSLASNAPLTVRLRPEGTPMLEPDISGVDGVMARLIGIVFTAMTDGTWIRLKACRNERCQKAFYDTSKNHSGAWCSMAVCGSRFKASAYRNRQAASV